ncbi:MAG: immunity 22 family protein [Prevotella sp.]|jgi:hypothetical protein|nr:immunity 22 family protein [Prevotella sp.]
MEVTNIKKNDMKRIHIWLGQFDKKKDFDDYLDQSAYLKAWAKYDNEESGDIKEPSPELRAKFCKEIGLDTYDEDFIIIKYNSVNSDIKQLISLIPANANKLLESCKRKGIFQANALIYYSDNNLSELDAEKTQEMSYLGCFEEEQATVIGGTGLQGLRNHLWIGITKKTKDEFLQYFEQSEYIVALRKYNNGETKEKPSQDLRSQFCKDVGINNYNPQYLYIYYSLGLEPIEKIIREHTPDKNLYDSMINRVHQTNLTQANAMFCYVDNGERNPNNDQQFIIFLKAMAEKYPKPPKAIEQKDNYNDLEYIGAFKWD